MLLLSFFLFRNVASQNIPAVCSAVSPNNSPFLVANGCVNGTENFFNTEFPEEFFNELCLCCTPGVDDNPPDNCVFNETEVAFQGKVTCNENFDCCLCGEIICNDCESVLCGGDESCLGVDPITINGVQTTGGSLICGGDISCFRTKVIAEFLTLTDCNGDFSCGNSTWELNLKGFIPSLPLSLSFTGDGAGFSNYIHADHVGSLSGAGDDSVPFSVFDLMCSVTMPCPITLNGDRSAVSAKWNITNAASLDTNGDESVSKTTFNIVFTPTGGPATVSGDDAAMGAIWDFDNLSALRCVGVGACRKSTFTIDFIESSGPTPVEIAGTMGAQMSTWVLTNPSSISCGNVEACQMMKLDAICAINGCSFSCRGLDSCQNGDFTLKNVDNVLCEGTNSCSDSVLDVECVSDGCLISCMGGCKDSVFAIEKSRGLTCNQQIPIFSPRVPGLVTGFEGTCENSIFILNNNVGGVGAAITCSAQDACLNATITAANGGVVTNLHNTGLTCIGIQACFDAEILGACADTTNGCPLMCTGQRACATGINSNATILLESVSTVQCSDQFACGPRIFDLLPVGGFSISCSGVSSCRTGDFRISDISLPITSIACDGTNACRDSIFSFSLAPLSTSLEITGSFDCTAQNSCRNTVIHIELNNINDAIMFGTFACTSQNSCRDTLILIKVNGRLLTEAELNAKIAAGTLNLNIQCNTNNFCNGAFVNNVLTFRSQAGFNALFPNAENPKLINQLGTLWVILIGVLIVIVIILAYKNRQYRKIERNMVINVKDFKSNKKDKRREPTKKQSPKAKKNNMDNNDDDIEIKYKEDATLNK